MSDTGKVWVVNPQTQEPMQVSAEEAQQGFVAGKLNLAAGQDVNLTSSDGKVFSGPADKAGNLIAQGWRFASADEVLASKAEGQGLRAAVEGAASALTVGGSDVAAQQLFDVEGLKQRRETTAGQLGEAGGMAASMFGPGLVEAVGGGIGKSVAMRAAEAALAPTNALTAAGNAVEAAAGRALAGTIESQAARNAVAAGLGRGIEGAAYGFGGGMSEEALGDPNANVSDLLAAGGMGALLGFGAGAAGGAGLRAAGDKINALRVKAKSSAGKISQKVMSDDDFTAAIEASRGEPFDDVGKKEASGWLYKQYKKVAEALGSDGADMDAVNSAFGQEVLREGKKFADGAGRQMRGVLDRIAAVEDASVKEGFGGARKAQAAALMPKGAAPEIVGEASNVLSNVKSQLEAIKESAAYKGLGDKGAAIIAPYEQVISEIEDKLWKRAGMSREVEEHFEREVESGGKNWVAKNPRQVPVEGAEAPFEQRLVDAVKETPEWRDDGRRFIADLREKFPELTPEEFNAKLFQAHKDGYVNMRRADLVGPINEAGMGAKLEQGVNQNGGEFHFVQPGEKAPPAGAMRTEYDAVSEPIKVKQKWSNKRVRDLRELADGGYDIPDEFAHEVFDQMNHLKQRFAKPGAFDRELNDAAQREVAGEFRNIYDGLAKHLEDTTVWGDAGKLQSEINSAYSTRSKAWKELESVFKFGPDGRIDPGSVQNYIANLDKVRGDRAMEALDAYQASNRKYADVMEKHFGGNGLSGEAKALDEQFSALRQNMKGKVEVLSAARRLKEASQAQYGNAGNAGVLAGALINAASPLGLVGAAGVDAILNPGRAASLRAHIMGAVDRIRGHMRGRVERLASGVERHIPDITGHTAQRLAGRSLGKLIAAKTPEERAAAYKEHVAEMDELADPMTFGDRVSRETLPFQAHAPAHADAMSTQAAGAFLVLRNSMPLPRTGSADQTSFRGVSEAPSYDDRMVRQYAQVASAIANPMEILDRAEQGQVLQHQVRAVEQAFPGFMQAIRYGIVSHAGGRKGRISHSKARVLQQLMGAQIIPGPKLAGFQSVHAAAANPQTPQGAPGPSPALKNPRSAGMGSLTDSLER